MSFFGVGVVVGVVAFTHVGDALEVEAVRGALVLLLERHLERLGGAEAHSADDDALRVWVLSKVVGLHERLGPAGHGAHPAAVRVVEAIVERVALGAAEQPARVGALQLQASSLLQLRVWVDEETAQSLRIGARSQTLFQRLVRRGPQTAVRVRVAELRQARVQQVAEQFAQRAHEDDPAVGQHAGRQLGHVDDLGVVVGTGEGEE